MTAFNVFIVIFGYFFGSVLFATIFGRLISKKDITQNTVDKNPGVFNAFKNGGTICGVLTLAGDLLKGFLPVFLYLNFSELRSPFWTASVVVAPILGHIFPIFNKFKGGKGITVSFGTLIGFLPDFKPVLCLAFVFLLFSLIIKINSEYYKTMITYPVTVVLMFFFTEDVGLVAGFLVATLFIILRFLLSKEEKEKLEVKFLWKCWFCLVQLAEGITLLATQ